MIQEGKSRLQEVVRPQREVRHLWLLHDVEFRSVCYSTDTRM